MAESFIKKRLKSIVLIMCVLSILFAGLSQTVSWVKFNAEAGIGGLADIQLDAEFYEAKVEYEASAQVEEDLGGLGGMVGGLVDLGGITAGGRNVTIPQDTIYYYEGLGRFQELVGVLYGTTKDADYWVNLKTNSTNDTRVNVNTHTDIIPWWPEGIGQEITVTIKLIEVDGVKNLRVNEVWIEVFKEWDEDEREYTDTPSKVWSTKPGDYLYKLNDTVEYKHPVTVEKAWGDKIGIIAKVDLTLTDIYNETDRIQRRPFPSTKHPQIMVNIIPVTQGQTFSIVLMVLAFPVTIIGIIITGIATVLVALQRRKRRPFLLAGAIINWMGVVFFVVGANTLIDLVEFIEPEWVTWNVLGLLIPIIAGALLFIAFLLDIRHSPKEEAEEEAEEKEIKFDISAAISEEEAEGEEELDVEAFECPQCGKEFTEMVPACPACGAEFEGVEEDEEEGEEEGEEGEGEESGEAGEEEGETEEEEGEE
ncbi:MAG: zinc ribbon domain-containing protein [Thermoplasmata archaeon]|nr:MAG: zinc ribbon domain-containing protein [Thermoplasmata archaeon]